MTRTERERRAMHRQLAKKSLDELAHLAKQIPMRFSADETLEDRITRLLPYVKRGWVTL